MSKLHPLANLPKVIVRKNLGKAMIYFNKSDDYLADESTKAFEELKKYTKPETIHLISRKLEKGSPCKERIKYWEDIERYYNQRQVGFFVCQVLAKRKIAIPLR